MLLADELDLYEGAEVGGGLRGGEGDEGHAVIDLTRLAIPCRESG